MRYQYSSSGFKQSLNHHSLKIPPGVKFLLISNIIIFILIELSGQKSLLFRLFGLVPAFVFEKFSFWQLFTYLFVHGGIFHLFFNMFILWMFGKDLESRWGIVEFLFFYFCCGVGAGFITIIFDMDSFVPIVGASGAIYGLLVAYGFMYPNHLVYLYGLFPLKVKYLVLGLGFIAFAASLSSSSSHISHITHLSGMVFGLSIIYFNFNFNRIKMFLLKLRLKYFVQNVFDNNERVQMNKRVDEILDKLNRKGWNSLTNKEEKFLTSASKKLFNNKRPN